MHFVAQQDAPALIGVPTILTVHDVVRHRYREWYRPDVDVGSMSASAARTWSRVTRAIEKHAIRRARRIIVPSRVTAEELSQSLAVPREAPRGDPRRHRPARAEPAPATRCGTRLPDRYLLHPGGAAPRKRLPELVRAFDEVARDDAALGLVLVGPVQTGDGATEAARAIAAASASDRIHLAGVLDDDDLAAVYRGARAVVLASRHEGFGRPVVEAFACGVPVVATAAPAIAEVAADAAVLVPVDEVTALADAVRKVLADPSLAESLRARGLVRAAQFRWGVAAVETLSVYEEVLGEPFGVRSR